MNKELVKRVSHLPDIPERLHEDILVGRQAVKACKAKIEAINNEKVAKELKDKILKEGQDVAETVLDAEVKLGELLKPLTERHQATSGSGRSSLPPGITHKESHIVQTLARNKRMVEKLKALAREQARLITSPEIYRKIKGIMTSHNNDEWYTPIEYIDATRQVMGSIDLDPASSEEAQEKIRAAEYFTLADSGLEKEWHGNIWMNPPWSIPLIECFIDKLIEEYQNGNLKQAVVLVNDRADTKWFHKIMKHSTAIGFTMGRIPFWRTEGPPAAPIRGQAIAYFGKNGGEFTKIFRKYLSFPNTGIVCTKLDGKTDTEFKQTNLEA